MPLFGLSTAAFGLARGSAIPVVSTAVECRQGVVRALLFQFAREATPFIRKASVNAGPVTASAQRDRAGRRQLLLAAAAAAAGIPLMIGAAAIGEAPWHLVLIWAPLSLAMNLFAWTALRFGWTDGWRDPGVTAAQIAWSIASTAACYAMLGPLRAAALPMLALALLFGIFALPARTVRWLAAWTLALYGGVMLLMGQLQPARYPLAEEAITFAALLVSVPVMSLLALRMSELRTQLGRQKGELEIALARIRELAERDELTGLFNRRRGTEALLAHRAHALRHGVTFAVAMADIDRFKTVNDRHGHAGGDAVLRAFAAAAQGELREIDTIARWGGEEFLIAFEAVDAESAAAAAERVRARTQQIEVGLPDGGATRITVSIGLAFWREGEPVETLVARADRALYRAKAEGRNRVVMG